MRSLSMLQMVGGVAVAGVVAAGSTALTGSGITRTGTAIGDAWVGGTITQLVSGSSVTGITYGHLDTAKTQTNSIVIVVADAASRYLSITPTGGSFSGGGTTADEWYCTDGSAATSTWTAGTAKIELSGTPVTITCNPALASGPHTTTNRYYSGLSSLALAVTAS